MRSPPARITSSLVVALALVACATEESTTPPVDPAADDEARYRAVLGIPAYLEVPAIPSFNPPTAEKLALGRALFYDRRISGNETQSCSSCHLQALGFSDGKKTPTGSTGQLHHRNSQGLANAVYNSTLTWAHNGLQSLEDQLQVPIRSDNPVELGVSDANVDVVLARFDQDPTSAAAFAAAFPESPSGATVDKIVFALATFCRSLVSANSPYDRFARGETTALTPQQHRGLTLFNGERLECFHCHSGVNHTLSYRDFATTEGTVRYPFFNNGLYNVDGEGSYPAQDQGLFDVTLDPGDRGRFRPQGLRNVAVTAPYMHDGSIATLEEVVRHYAAGGRVIASGPFAGDGRLSPLKSGLVRGFAITDEEVADVVAFLESFTDAEFLTNPAFADPSGSAP